MFSLIGITIPWDGWADLGWRGAALSVTIVLLRRLPAMALIHRGVDAIQHPRDWLFVGWFGPIGVSSVFYAMLALDRGVPHADTVWAITSQVIVVSLLVHGLTATPLARYYQRTATRSLPTPGRPASP